MGNHKKVLKILEYYQKNAKSPEHIEKLNTAYNNLNGMTEGLELNTTGTHYQGSKTKCSLSKAETNEYEGHVLCDTNSENEQLGMRFSCMKGGEEVYAQVGIFVYESDESNVINFEKSRYVKLN